VDLLRKPLDLRLIDSASLTFLPAINFHNCRLISHIPPHTSHLHPLSSLHNGLRRIHPHALLSGSARDRPRRDRVSSAAQPKHRRLAAIRRRHLQKVLHARPLRTRLSLHAVQLLGILTNRLHRALGAERRGAQDKLHADGRQAADELRAQFRGAETEGPHHGFEDWSLFE